MKYKITDLLSISVDDQYNTSKTEAASLLAIMCGLVHVPELSQGSANVFKGGDGAHYWIAKSNIAGEVDFSEYADMQQFAPHHNAAICQTLAHKFGFHVSGLPYEGGMLSGLWKVEFISGYGVTNFAQNGWTYGANEPVMETSTNLFEAICRTALRLVGVGRKAYLLTVKDSPKQTLIHMSDWVYQWIVQNTADAEYLIRVPELDMYAITGIDEKDAEEIISEALANLTQEEVSNKAVASIEVQEPEQQVKQETVVPESIQ